MRGGLTRNLSLISGLVLFAFALTHFLNHAVGLFSLEMMDQVQEWRLVVTRSWPGMIILAAALLVHIVFGLLKLYRRRTLRLPAWELTQLVLGVAIPFLLLPHIVDTHIAHAAFGVQDSYLYELARLWPRSAQTQSLLLLIVWIHGCLGLHHWLKFKAWYRTLQPVLLVIAIAIPLAALAGFAVSGRAVGALLSDTAIAERMRALTHWPNSLDDDALTEYRFWAQVVFAIALALVVATVTLRRLSMLAAPKIAIAYTSGPKVQTAIGPTLLEISRSAGVAHASACGGRARCGTCRVRIDEGAETLPPPAFAEQFTLARVGAPDGARLACQIRPVAPVSVTRLVRLTEAEAAAEETQENTDDAGVKKPLTLLYLRMRDAEGIARDRLPYDVMFILNEFFGAAGAAIDRNFGWVDRFYGDGVLAVFGQQRGSEQGAKDALRTAQAIDLALDRLNEKVAAELGHPVDVAVGVHTGSFVLGRIGLGKTSVVSVIGDGTEIAQQLAGLAHDKNVQVAVSMDAAKLAGILDLGEHHIVTLPSKSAASVTIEARAIARGREIILEEPAQPATAAAS